VTSNTPEYQREWYHLNKHRLKHARRARNKRDYERAKRYVVRQKLLRGECAVCRLDCHQGNLHHFEWDHREPEQKGFNIADGMKKPLRTIAIELEKCDLLCLFCHRDRTIHEKHWANNRETEPEQPWEEMQLFDLEDN